MSAAAASDAHTNRLAKEQSPYLLQHAHNPVDWYPWGEEAFAKARSENKPIFLSVGYSTCHWCHVMEKESFESDAVAELMNKSFVNIKVDREERPDVDKVYMTYVQATSGGGGWPMSVFLTPQLQPIVGGTYFPPEDKYGRPGFKTVLRKVAEVWASDKDKLQQQGEQVMQAIAEAASEAEPSSNGELNAATAHAIIESAAESLATRFDASNGGFSTAPKFPRMSEVNVLLVRHVLAKAAGEQHEADDALRMAERTLRKMAAGGIYDHIGGGFSRYSVDELWHVPHFEKMLYDNPQIARTYLDAFALTGKLDYARVIRGILDYLRRDMIHPEGGLFSAEDADSLDKAGTKAEGAFYLWTADEIDEVLGADTEKGRLFKEHYSVRAAGNCNMSPRSDPHREFTGKNCLIVRTELKGDVARWEALLAEARRELHARRAQRPRPHLDDKVVTAWNGLAIGAFARAARVLKSEDPPISPSFPVEGVPAAEYMKTAIRAAEFVEKNLWNRETKRLLRSFCRQPSDVAAFADDYAYLSAGLLDLFEASGDVRWLRWAHALQDTMDELFWDSSSGGYFSTAGTDASILLRQKEDYDGAEPAASSIALSNLLRLAALSSPEEAERLQRQAGKVAAAFQGRLMEMPLALTQMACSLQLHAAGHLRQVVIAGKKGAEETEALIDAAHAVYCPDKVVIPIDTEDEAQVTFLKEHNPEALAMAQGKKEGMPAAAFICQNFACRAPTNDPDRVRMLLSEPAGASSATGKKAEVDLSSLKTS